MPLDHLQDGTARRDGQLVTLYDPKNPAAAQSALFNDSCISWSFGPLAIEACADLSVPQISARVTLMGKTLGECTLSPAHTDCVIGGSILGFKAEVRLQMLTGPLRLHITAEVCAPFAGCKSFDVTIPIGG